MRTPVLTVSMRLAFAPNPTSHALASPTIENPARGRHAPATRMATDGEMPASSERATNQTRIPSFNQSRTPMQSTTAGRRSIEPREIFL